MNINYVFTGSKNNTEQLHIYALTIAVGIMLTTAYLMEVI